MDRYWKVRSHCACCEAFSPLRLATEVGWRYGESVKKLEEKRKQKGVKHLERLRRFRKFRAQATIEARNALTAEQNAALDAVRVTPADLPRGGRK